MMINKRTALATALLSLIAATAGAQQAGHQMAGMASGGGAAMCAQSSEGVTRTIDVVNARIEDARQTNDAAKLRAAIADLQSVFAQMKTQLADCVALAGETGGAMGSMPGMDHSKMNMTPGTPVMQPGSLTPAPGAAGGAAMPGMDHSKMQMAPAASAKPPASAPAAGQMAGMDHSKMQMPAKPANAAAPARAQPAAPAGGVDHSKMQMPAKPAAAKAAQPAAGMDHSKMAAGSGSKAGAEEPSNKAGIDHSKMTGSSTAARPAAGMHGSAAPAAAVVFSVRTDPAPPRGGKNDFEVTLKDAEGKPITDADVSLAFYMPAMPSMNLPEMRSAAQLTSAGNGVYKGSGTVGMPGDWDVTITAARKGQTLGTKKMKLTAK